MTGSATPRSAVDAFALHIIDEASAPAPAKPLSPLAKNLAKLEAKANAAHEEKTEAVQAHQAAAEKAAAASATAEQARAEAEACKDKAVMQTLIEGAEEAEAVAAQAVAAAAVAQEAAEDASARLASLVRLMRSEHVRLTTPRFQKLDHQQDSPDACVARFLAP